MIKLFTWFNKNSFLLILFVLLILSTVFWWKFYGKFEIADDAYQYHNAAISLMDNFTYSLDGQLTMMREPGYSFFIFLIYKVFGVNPGAVRIIQVVLLFIIAIIANYLCKKIFNDLIAKIVSLIIIIYPMMNILTSFIYSEIFAGFLAMSSLLFLYFALTKRKLSWFGLAGMFFGFLVMVKSVFILMPIPVFMYILFKDIKVNRQESLKKSLVFVALFSVIVFPWLFRNYHYFGRFSLSSRGGNMIYTRGIKNTYDSLETKKYVISALSGEYIVRRFIDPEYNFEKSYIKKEALRNFTEQIRHNVNVDNYDALDVEMKKEGIKLIKNQPFRYLMFGLVELVNLNSPIIYCERQISIFNETDVHKNTALKVSAIIILRLGWYLFNFLVIFGICKIIKKRVILAYPLIFFVLVVNGVLFFLQGNPRFIIPIFPVYLILAISGLTELFKKFNSYNL